MTHDDQEGQEGQPVFFMGDVREMVEHAGQAHRMYHVADDASAQLAKAVAVEFKIEYELVRARAVEFDYLLVGRESPCSLEQAAAGYARHLAGEWMANWLAERGSSTGGERAEYKAQEHEHQAAVLRWMNQLTEAIAFNERMAAAKAGVAQ